MVLAVALCALANLAPTPERFAGTIVTPQAALLSVATLVLIGTVASTYSARRAVVGAVF